MMNYFELYVNLGNQAMHDEHDIARALRQVAARLQVIGDKSGVILDVNGNKVGAWEFGERKRRLEHLDP